MLEDALRRPGQTSSYLARGKTLSFGIDTILSPTTGPTSSTTALGGSKKLDCFKSQAPIVNEGPVFPQKDSPMSLRIHQAVSDCVTSQCKDTADAEGAGQTGACSGVQASDIAEAEDFHVLLIRRDRDGKRDPSRAEVNPAWENSTTTCISETSDVTHFISKKRPPQPLEEKLKSSGNFSPCSKLYNQELCSRASVTTTDAKFSQGLSTDYPVACKTLEKQARFPSGVSGNSTGESVDSQSHEPLCRPHALKPHTPVSNSKLEATGDEHHTQNVLSTTSIPATRSQVSQISDNAQQAPVKTQLTKSSSIESSPQSISTRLIRPSPHPYLTQDSNTSSSHISYTLHDMTPSDFGWPMVKQFYFGSPFQIPNGDSIPILPAAHLLTAPPVTGQSVYSFPQRLQYWDGLPHVGLAYPGTAGVNAASDSRVRTCRLKPVDKASGDSCTPHVASLLSGEASILNSWSTALSGQSHLPWREEGGDRLPGPELYPERGAHTCPASCHPKKKKPRTSFSRVQIVELEKRFHRQKYLASMERSSMAKLLKMTDAQVKTWFQNRRTKWRRQTADERDAEREAASRLMLNLQQADGVKAESDVTEPHVCLSSSSLHALQNLRPWFEEGEGGGDTKEIKVGGRLSEME